jgi:3-methyladenine DNA glycosylase AlkD
VNDRSLATEIWDNINALPEKSTQPIRALRREYTHKLKSAAPEQMLTLAQELIRLDEKLRWVAYELIHFHKPTLQSLGKDELEALGRGMDSWDKVDTFAPYLSGVAWRNRQISDDVIHHWARSENRWWRRAALVSTIPLNTKARGGRGDVPRTLAVCELLAGDQDDMVVKAMSWALRECLPYDAEAVRAFLLDHNETLAARVKREVRNKLETGLKNPKKECS